MYLVRNKKTKEIIHANPAPLSQGLQGKDVYFKFDPRTMEIGKTDSGSLPEHFNINKAGEIVELTPAEKASVGLLALAPDEKIADGQIVKKTLSEQVADGVLTLLPSQKITGKGEDEKIADKTLAEQVTDGLVQLAPNQKLVGEAIVEKTTDEMLKEGLLTLDEVKQKKIQYFSDLSLQKRAALLPDYKLQNAALGVYDEQTLAGYKATVQAFRDEFYRLQGLIEKAKTLKKIDAISDNFPTEIVAAAPQAPKE